VVSGACTGSTRCSTQTLENVCNALDGCYFEPAQPHCAGPKPAACSTHSVEACQSAVGCRIEW
jgi:hypothetical protein